MQIYFLIFKRSRAKKTFDEEKLLNIVLLKEKNIIIRYQLCEDGEYVIRLLKNSDGYLIKE